MQLIQAWIKITFLLGLLGFAAGIVKIGINYIWPDLHPQKIETVYDESEMISRNQADAIRTYHKELLKDHDIDYRILLTASGEDLSTLAHRIFSEKKIGSLSQSGRGLLLIVDSSRNDVRLEVSTALEGVYTDAFVSYLQHRQMVPFFQTGRIADGILATTEMIFTRAQEAERNQDFNPPMDSSSAGGGTENPAQINAGKDLTFRQGADVRASGDPVAVLNAYQQAMATRNGNPHLSIYTHDTQSMLERRTVTPGQMSNEAKNLKSCLPGKLAVADAFAVIRFPAQARNCPPYFLRSEDGAGKLDLTMMQTAIRFNHRNFWHFDVQYNPVAEPYGFAFTDWIFDQYGFPHAR
jgi:uncharacterized protein